MNIHLVNSGRCDFYAPDPLLKSVPPVLWKALKICMLGIVLAGLVQASGQKAPRELLLRLQQVVQQGDLEAARSQLDAAIKEFPSEPALYNLLGVVEVQR